MKTRILSILLALSLGGLCGGSLLRAQTAVQKDLDVPGGFSSIVANNAFQITYRNADYYRVEWSADELVMDYVEVNVRANTLNIGFNEKSLPKELKKTFKGRNAPKLVLRVTIYAPKFSSLALSEDASFDATGTTFNTDNFNLEMTGESHCTNLSIGAEKARVEMSKSATAILDFGADNIEIKTDDKAILNLKQDSDKIFVESAGSSSIKVSGDSKEVSVQGAGSSKINMDGNAMNLSLSNSKNCEFDGTLLKVNTATLVMNSSTATVNAADKISLNIKGGAKVYFLEDPTIEVVDIISSSLSHYNSQTVKRK